MIIIAIAIAIEINRELLSRPKNTCTLFSLLDRNNGQIQSGHSSGKSWSRLSGRGLVSADKKCQRKKREPSNWVNATNSYVTVQVLASGRPSERASELLWMRLRMGLGLRGAKEQEEEKGELQRNSKREFFYLFHSQSIKLSRATFSWPLRAELNWIELNRAELSCESC